MVTGGEQDADKTDRQARILQAVIDLLATQGISGVSMRAVAREAGVALGLLSYYYADKRSLIAAALRQIETQDLAIVQPDVSLPADQRLATALHRVADPEFLDSEYLALRLQLWALAQADDEFEQINAGAQQRYRDSLAELIGAARPDLAAEECERRAADIAVIQNGMWLTALLGLDRAAVARSVARTEAIALE